MAEDEDGDDEDEEDRKARELLEKALQERREQTDGHQPVKD